MIRRIELQGVNVLICKIEKSADSRRENERHAIERLIEVAFGKEAELGHRADGAPFIAGNDASISISHSLDYAALAYSYEKTIGIDIEQPRGQLRRVAPRVLSDKEMAIYGNSDELLLRAWTLKEALYKAALTPEVDFRAEINLPLELTSDTAIVAGKELKISKVDHQTEYALAVVCC